MRFRCGSECRANDVIVSNVRRVKKTLLLLVTIALMQLQGMIMLFLCEMVIPC